MVAAQRHAAERAVREEIRRESLHRAAFDSAPIGIVLADLDGRWTRVNPRLRELLGYPHDERERNDVRDMQADDVPVETDPFRRIAMGELDRYRIDEKRYRRRDGSFLFARVNVSVHRDVEGRPLHFISFIEETAVLPPEQSQRLAAIVDSSTDAIISKTLDGVIMSWNEGAERLLGYAAKEVVGRAIGSLVPANEVGEEAAIIARLGEGELIESFDTLRVRKDGQELHVSATLSPIRDASGMIVGTSTIVRDITERYHAAEILACSNEATAAANRDLEAFSYAVAHDLRAPLRGMNGFAHLLLETYRDALDEEGRDWLKEIVFNATKMAGLIDSLLALARLTKVDPRRSAVDLSDLFRAVGSELAAAEPGRDVRLKVEDELTADLDPALARSLVENLLGNAWKFTNKVAHARIEVGRTDSAGGANEFFVRDNGAGFDMAFANKLFGPFQRLHSVDEFPGTGIGLATVQRIVRRHGGRVWADGIVGGGATFHFSFPPRAAVTS